MKKFLSILAVAVAALLVSACGPKYEGFYKADLTYMQSGVYSTIAINGDGSANFLDGATNETINGTWTEYIDKEGNKVANCIRIDFDIAEGVPYIMNFETKLISYGYVQFGAGEGYKFQKIR